VKPSIGTMVKRGMVRHCPHCGSGGLFAHWFRMVERCPRCGIKFEREEGFYLGAFLINFAIGEGLIAVAQAAQHQHHRENGAADDGRPR